MIGIINYGVGNIGSLQNALTFLGLQSNLSKNPDELSQYKALILPGVGAFPPAMEKLNDSGLVPFLRDWVKEKRPLLGICLGMQLLMTASEENGLTPGLGLISGQVVKLKDSPRSIHIGWNTVSPRNSNDLIPGEGYAYFVHSYACQLDNVETVIGETTYGVSFASVVRSGNVIGVQFHPEKSQKFGLAFLKRFADGIF